MPKGISGWSRSICMACNAQGQGTIKVVELTTPSVSERRMPALHAWDLPKSSALMINNRASSGYPSIRFVWLLCDWVIISVSLLSCFACSICVVLFSIKYFSSNGYKFPESPDTGALPVVLLLATDDAGTRRRHQAGWGASIWDWFLPHQRAIGERFGQRGPRAERFRKKRVPGSEV